MKMTSGQRYYVLKGGSWFFFVEGHYSHSPNFTDAKGTNSILEAVRMRAYSGGQIVSVSLNVEDVDCVEVDAAIKTAAQKKLDESFTKDERRVLGL